MEDLDLTIENMWAEGDEREGDERMGAARLMRRAGSTRGGVGERAGSAAGSGILNIGGGRGGPGHGG